MASTVIDNPIPSARMAIPSKLDRQPDKPTIVDIRQDKAELSMHDEIIQGLQADEGNEKTLPTMLLYDENGLQLFEAITFLDEYYLTNVEIEVLETCAIDIVRRIQPNSMLVELGSGNLRKTCILLNAFERLARPCRFFALDLSLPELQRTLSALPEYRHVSAVGLHGTYDDGLTWLKRSENSSTPKCIMILGSSIGNFGRADASSFLEHFSKILIPGRDCLLIGLDGCQDSSRVYKAYNDERGTTRRFILNGLVHANRILGEEVFKAEDWEYVGAYDKSEGRHQAFYVPKRDVQYGQILIKAGEKVRVEESYKYSPLQRAVLWTGAGLRESARFGAEMGDVPYFIHLLTSSHAGPSRQ